jgi:hypothetical protein
MMTAPQETSVQQQIQQYQKHEGGRYVTTGETTFDWKSLESGRGRNHLEFCSGYNFLTFFS